MEKIDRRKTYYLVFDTETTNSMDDPIVYDIGGAVVDKNGNNVEEKIVEEKRVPPSATAIIFALCNRDPEHWQNRVSNDISGKIETENKGAGVSLANVPDSLLSQVIEAINGK